MWPEIPGHATTQGAAYYAQDFTSDISVCIVSGHRHGTKHGLGYTKPGDTKYDYKHKSGYDQHAARNHINPDRNDFHHRNQLIRFNGNIANQPARKHHQRQSCGNSGNTGRCRQRGIGNRRNSGFHTDADRNFDHRGTMHAFQQHWNVNHG